MKDPNPLALKQNDIALQGAELVGEVVAKNSYIIMVFVSPKSIVPK